MDIVMENRLYKIRDGIPFRAGHLPDGNQILVSRFGSNAIGVRFSRDGKLLGFDRYEIGPEADVPDSEVAAFLDRLGVVTGGIQMQAFALPEYGIETRDLPEYLQEYLDSPEDFPKQRAMHLEKAISDWNRSGGFVLVWGEDFELDANGDVEST